MSDNKRYKHVNNTVVRRRCHGDRRSAGARKVRALHNAALPVEK